MGPRAQRKNRVLKAKIEIYFQLAGLRLQMTPQCAGRGSLQHIQARSTKTGKLAPRTPKIKQSCDSFWLNKCYWISWIKFILHEKTAFEKYIGFYRCLFSSYCVDSTHSSNNFVLGPPFNKQYLIFKHVIAKFSIIRQPFQSLTPENIVLGLVQWCIYYLSKAVSLP